MNPLVSVIIPTYNRLEFLKEAIASVQRQTYAPLEIIVVDDGSNDKTEEKIPYLFPSITFLRQSHQGVSAARNKGIKQAKGSYIAFLDSDDLWLPRKLEEEMNILQANPSLSICYTDEIWIRRGVRVNPMKKHQKHGGWIYPYCLPLCIISPSSVILRREVFDRVGLFDESLPACEDYDLWLRVTARYPVHFIEKHLIVKRGGHEDQLSRAFWGMDRFRVYALTKILEEGTLSPPWKRLTIQELKRKCRILINGFEKRNKWEDAVLYRHLVHSIDSPSERGRLNPLSFFN